MTPAVVRRLGRAEQGPALRRALAEVLVDCVEGGASVGFLSPLGLERAEAFWSGVLDSQARGERVVLVAEDAATATVLGTAQVVVAAPENQPHRGELAKVLVHRRARRRGVGEALLTAAEAVALDAGKTLLTLDTASTDAERLYERAGWQRVGAIPGYALWPDGSPVATALYYKELAARL